MGEKDGPIHVKPDWLSGTFIRKESGWSLFWMLLHEILHRGGGKYEHRRTRGNNQAPFMLETRDISLQGSKTRKEVSEIGWIEFELNVIRIGFGLPVRTNYAEAPPSIPHVHEERGRLPVAVYFGDTPGADRKEYVGAVMSGPEFPDEKRREYAADVFAPKDYDPLAEKELAEHNRRDAVQREWVQQLVRIDKATFAPADSAKRELPLSFELKDDQLVGRFKRKNDPGTVTGTVGAELVRGKIENITLTLRWSSGKKEAASEWKFALDVGSFTKLKSGFPVEFSSNSGAPPMTLRIPAFTRAETAK